MSGTRSDPVTNPSPPVAPAAVSETAADNWLNHFGASGPAARLLRVLERLETSQANLNAADGGKAGLFRAKPTPQTAPGAATVPAETLTHLQNELAQLRQANQALQVTQLQAADRLAALLPSLAAHLGENSETTVLTEFAPFARTTLQEVAA